MNLFRRADGLDPRETGRIGFGERSETGGDGTVVGRRTSLDGIGSLSPLHEALRQSGLVTFEQDHPVGA